MQEQSLQIDNRKADHIRINLEEDVRFKRLSTGLESFFFMHEALPELDFASISTETEIFGKKVSTPLFISSMTGGTDRANRINRILAETAEEVGMAMGLGSQRAAIEDAALAESFHVRQYAPTVPIFANVGVVQLNYGFGVDEMEAAVDMCQADALFLHLNVLQEAVQPEGDRNWAGLLPKIEMICRKLSVPVIAKEVGWGISASTAKRLIDAGIAAIDVAGAGGTSWSQVEMYRAETARDRRIAGAFIDWGIPTAHSLRYCRSVSNELPLFASGGIRNGIEIAKCVALGATLVGIAGDFLKAAVEGETEGGIEFARTVTEELKVAMLAAGAGSIEALSKTPLHTQF